MGLGHGSVRSATGGLIEQGRRGIVTKNNMTPEYVRKTFTPYRWDEARERIPNDYRTKDDKPTEYAGSPMTKGELMDFLEDMKNDQVM